MTDLHAEMHENYTRVNTEWGAHNRVITDDDSRTGKRAEVVRWCRDRLGGRDQDLVGPERWERACREGWSKKATYGCFPSVKPGQTWSSWMHDVAHWLYPMLSSEDEHRRYGDHDAGHAHLELELTELVIGWLTDDAAGIERTFPPLNLSRPPDLRQSRE
jgi:hypothetical protein